MLSHPVYKYKDGYVRIFSGESYSFPEAYLTWGGKNFCGDYGPLDAAMISNLGANRFAFLRPAGVAIEYSTDSGETWYDYESPDLDKLKLFGEGRIHFLGKHSANGSSTIGDMLRITISTS